MTDSAARGDDEIALGWLGDVVRRGQFELITCRVGRAAVLFAALLLAACTASSSAYAPQDTASLPAKTAEAPMAPDILREHQRILAA